MLFFKLLFIPSWELTLLHGRSGKLRLTIRINPPFVRFTRWDDTPLINMTTFLFSSAKPDQASTVVRLLNFGESGEGGTSRLSMEAAVVVNTSSLCLTFDHFPDTLFFDPGTFRHVYAPKQTKTLTEALHPPRFRTVAWQQQR
jgi:hypothetical protein